MNGPFQLEHSGLMPYVFYNKIKPPIWHVFDLQPNITHTSHGKERKGMERKEKEKKNNDIQG